MLQPLLPHHFSRSLRVCSGEGEKVKMGVEPVFHPTAFLPQIYPDKRLVLAKWRTIQIKTKGCLVLFAQAAPCSYGAP